MKTEDDPFDPNPPRKARQTLSDIRQLEAMPRLPMDWKALFLRYGALYGPGSAISQDGTIVEMVRRCRWPIVGNGAGIWSFVHITDAAAATGIAVERGMPGVDNIVDDAGRRSRIGCPNWRLRSARNRPIAFRPGWAGLRSAIKAWR